MKYYLCIEHGEEFIVEAESFEDAKESAQLYGGECIRELTEKETQDHQNNYHEIN